MAPTLVAPEICVRFQPNSSDIGSTNTVNIPMDVTELAKLIPEIAASASQP